jgi:hypothetical protein
MNEGSDYNFRWDELLKRIKRKNVIPVIGLGLYRVEADGESGLLLYNYLAQKLADEAKVDVPRHVNHRFAKAALEFLKKNDNDYLVLSEFLKELLGKIRLIPANPLWKLARIKAFDVFITTAYDDFLAGTIKTVRSVPTKALFYTVGEKDLNLLDNDLFNSLKDSRSTLVYHIFGNMEKCMVPAYTEKDILETIMEFRKDMEAYKQNNLFRKLESSSLLFMGCGYDDWLFRFFIRTVANEPYESPRKSQKCKFVDAVPVDDKESVEELLRFLKVYGSEVFISDGSDFVDLLFEKLEQEQKETIIQPPDFPGFAFISFEGKDRPAANRLADYLRKDGIDVWLDERKFNPGDDVDETIIKAIDKCPVFIPLISKNSQRLQTDEGKLKYHCREWERALSNKIADEKSVTIIPVKIDDTDWLYDKFERIFYIDVPGGNKAGDYEKLKVRLQDIQGSIRG